MNGAVNLCDKEKELRRLAADMARRLLHILDNDCPLAVLSRRCIDRKKGHRNFTLFKENKLGIYISMDLSLLYSYPIFYS